jgi:tetratricopeptide (TPR) repeat protein
LTRSPGVLCGGNSINYPQQSPFVGRERELAELGAGLEDARHGRGRFFLLTGDPGIGKSRLADELAADAARSGWAVVRGGCWEGAGALAYWPFMQIIRAALRGSRRADQTGQPSVHRMPPLPLELAQLVPDLLPAAAPQPAVSSQPSINPEQARFMLFDAVARLLRELSHLKPLLLIIEDLHDADQPSLLMLRLVVRELKDAPVLTIGTYRDIEVRRSPILAQLIGELTREGTPVPLFALSREEAARMIEARKGTPAVPRLVSEIYQATAGNPLFIDGLVRVLIAEDRLSVATRLDLAAFRVPDGVREAIRQWLALLSNRSLLIIAATIGQEFDLACVQRMTQLPRNELVDLLREASGAGILVQVSRDAYRFSHALIRDALCDELNSADSRDLHLKIGEALEEIYRANLPSHAAQLAHHFREGGDLGKATDYFISAGEAAFAVFAYEEAAAHWRAALELMLDIGEQRERRANLLERLGDLLALDAAGGSEHIKLLEQALELYQVLGQAQAAGLIHLRLALWKALHPSADISQVSQHCEKALELFKRDPTALSSILSYLGLGVDAVRRMTFDEALTATRQGMDLSERAGDKFFWARASGTRAVVLCYLGRPGESFDLADRTWLQHDQLSDNIGGWITTVTACHQLLMLMDPAQAEAWVNRELGKPRITKAQASFVEKSLSEHLGLAQILMGNLAQAEGLVARSPARPLFGGYSLKEHLAFYMGDWPGAEILLAQSTNEQVRAHVPLQFCIRSLMAARLLRLQGRPLEAESILEKILAMLPTGPGALIEMAARHELALDCAGSGRLVQAQVHLARCCEIMAAGEDWRGLAGCVARAEGALAAAQGRFREADDRFAQSVEIFRRYQVPFEEAETLHYWGRAQLLAGDQRIALEKLDAAADLYRRHGAGERWLDRVQADRLLAHDAGASRVESSRELPEPAAKTTTDQDSRFTGMFRKEGEYWTLAWGGREARLKERRGFHYIAWLLRYPGHEIAAAELVAKVESAGFRAPGAGLSRSYEGQVTITAGLGDAGEALDSKARAQYEQRLKELREELDLAEQLNDHARTQAARTEIEFIEDELAAAAGLGGRARKIGSHAERARLAVTKTVKAALVRIRQANPELGRHLTNSIRTGNFCAYLPQQPVLWSL